MRSQSRRFICQVIVEGSPRNKWNERPAETVGMVWVGMVWARLASAFGGGVEKRLCGLERREPTIDVAFVSAKAACGSSAFLNRRIRTHVFLLCLSPSRLQGFSGKPIAAGAARQATSQRSRCDLGRSRLMQFGGRQISQRSGRAKATAGQRTRRTAKRRDGETKKKETDAGVRPRRAKSDRRRIGSGIDRCSLSGANRTATPTLSWLR